MIKICGSALNYLRKNNYIVILKIINTNLCWGTTPTKTPWIEVRKSFTPTDDIDLYEYEGIKIYVDTKLIVSDNAVIKLKKTPSILGNKLCFEGISIS